jgi:hypothetical protein
MDLTSVTSVKFGCRFDRTDLRSDWDPQYACAGRRRRTAVQTVQMDLTTVTSVKLGCRCDDTDLRSDWDPQYAYADRRWRTEVQMVQMLYRCYTDGKDRIENQ